MKFAILEMNELEAALSLTMELESGRLPLTRVREGGITDFLRKQNIPIIIRRNPVLRYTNGAARRVAVCFRNEKQLLATFKGTRMKDAPFDGLPEAPWRHGALYPDPLGEQYVEVVQDIGGTPSSTSHSLQVVIGHRVVGTQTPTREEALSASRKGGGRCGSSPLAHAR